MIQKLLFFLLFGFFALIPPAFSQEKAPGTSPPDASSRLQVGMELYRMGRFAEASSVLNSISPLSPEYSESLYWSALSDLSAGKYNEALRGLESLENLEKYSASGIYRTEIPYHKGRILYYQGRYNDAIVLLASYYETEPNKIRKSAALYWAGECLFALGQFDMAGDVFAQIVEDYPESSKFEAALYRMEIIKQKKVELELLEILKWTHEESLKNLEDYQRQEKTYNQAIAAYQKRLADLQGDTRAADLELSNEEYKQYLRAAEERIALLEARLQEANAAREALNSTPPDITDNEKNLQLLALKMEILSLANFLAEKLDKIDGAGKGKK
jgi:tetratricopeptide (TPR) repeat protein